ncbi:hypothetical protein [Corynebacterium aquilae]|uniref:Uncharacterized protein n=1 Tax=Corynebacterium aquilae DSM 44791 TaxID=1431546 RepID=A0A1L7CIH5_9CORY|nr:hypothetical protein [Corynebacterium aquilae]APT85661.1 hypothetical protein CAQU_12135 [Corynebacterium aquilae DSM 44791]
MSKMRGLLYSKAFVFACNGFALLVLSVFLLAEYGVLHAVVGGIFAVAVLIFQWHVLSELHRLENQTERFARSTAGRLSHLQSVEELPRKFEQVKLEINRLIETVEEADSDYRGENGRLRPANDPSVLRADRIRGRRDAHLPGRGAADIGSGLKARNQLVGFLKAEAAPPLVAVLRGDNLKSDLAGIADCVEVDPFESIETVPRGVGLLMISQEAFEQAPWNVVVDASGTAALLSLCDLLKRASERGILTVFVGPIKAGHHAGAIREAVSLHYQGSEWHEKFGDALPELVHSASSNRNKRLGSQKES